MSTSEHTDRYEGAYRDDDVEQAGTDPESPVAGAAFDDNRPPPPAAVASWPENDTAPERTDEPVDGATAYGTETATDTPTDTATDTAYGTDADTDTDTDTDAASVPDADRDAGTDVQGEADERLADPEPVSDPVSDEDAGSPDPLTAPVVGDPRSAAADGSVSEPATGGDEGERILVDDPDGVRQRWNSVQVGFVDDPRQAVGDAGQLVDEVVELVVAGVGAQRDRLGETWSADDLDTEQLRLALRQYREFLDRLLAV
jgi:hypothetical protein